MSAKKPPEQKVANIAPFGLRMPPALRDLIGLAAERSGRSMNAEIVARLEQSFAAPNVEIESLKPIGLNRENAATFIGVDPPELDKLCSWGLIPKPRMFGDYPIWDREELEEAMRTEHPRA